MKLIHPTNNTMLGSMYGCWPVVGFWPGSGSTFGPGHKTWPVNFRWVKTHHKNHLSGSKGVRDSPKETVQQF